MLWNRFDIVISIVDYWVGHLGSITNMLKHLGMKSRIVTTVAEI